MLVRPAHAISASLRRHTAQPAGSSASRQKALSWRLSALVHFFGKATPALTQFICDLPSGREASVYLEPFEGVFRNSRLGFLECPGILCKTLRPFLSRVSTPHGQCNDACKLAPQTSAWPVPELNLASLFVQ